MCVCGEGGGVPDAERILGYTSCFPLAAACPYWFCSILVQNQDILLHGNRFSSLSCDMKTGPWGKGYIFPLIYCVPMKFRDYTTVAAFTFLEKTNRRNFTCPSHHSYFGQAWFIIPSVKLHLTCSGRSCY